MESLAYSGSNLSLLRSVVALFAAFGFILLGWNAIYNKRLFFGAPLILLGLGLGFVVLGGLDLLP